MIREKKYKTKFRFTFWALFLVILLSFLIIQCSISKPTAPTWNVTLTVPLINKYYSMTALIDKMDEPYLKVDSVENPGFYFEEKLDTVRLTDKLLCDSAFANFKDTLGIINVHPGESRQLILNASEFYSGPAGYVPPCTATVEKDLDTFSTFSQVTAKEAFTTLTVSNQLGLDLNWIQIKIIDRNFEDTLETIILVEGIDAGDSNTQNVIFTNKTFSNRLGIQIKASTPGGEILSSEDKYLSVNFTIDSLTVISGSAKIPSFELSREEEILLPTKSVVDSAHIKSGSLFINLSNLTNLDAELQVDFPELQKDGKILSFVRDLPALGNSNLILAVDGYTFRPESGNKVQVQTKVRSPGSGDALIDFKSSDSVSLEATFSEIIFNQITGIIESTRIDIGNITRELEIPSGFESAHLTSASLNLEIHNGVNLPANLSMVIHGDQGQELNLSSEIEAGGPFGTSITSIFEDQLESLFSPVPQTLTVTGQVICGDGQTFGIVREEDFFFGIIKVSSPLELIWDSCQVQIDKDSDEVNDDVKELIEDQINSSRVVFKIESHLPLEAKAKILVSRRSDNLFSDPDLVVGPIDVPKGKLNYDGLVNGSNFSQDEISLTHTELQVFTNVPFYMAGSIEFPGTNGQTVKASAGDFIKITSYLELDVKNKKEQGK
jgi:hypothetical protein